MTRVRFLAFQHLDFIGSDDASGSFRPYLEEQQVSPFTVE